MWQMADDDKADVLLYKKAPSKSSSQATTSSPTGAYGSDPEIGVTSGRHDRSDDGALRDFSERGQMCCGDRCTKRGIPFPSVLRSKISYH
jgi:hypothetical protein